MPCCLPLTQCNNNDHHHHGDDHHDHDHHDHHDVVNGDSMLKELDFKMSEKVCLKWNDFTENVKASFGSLRRDADSADVTLVCDDGQRLEAHQAILAASSFFFESLLKSNNHSHTLIYITDVKFQDMGAILDFLYFGEVNVCETNLDSFLNVGEELKLSGLMGGVKVPRKESGSIAHPENPKKFRKKKPVTNRNFKKENVLIAELDVDDKTAMALPNNLSGHLEELDEKVKSMMEKSSQIITFGKVKHQTRADRCKLCGKEGQAVNIRDHIETNHLEGIFLPCSLCEQTFRSRHKLRCHIRVCQAD